MDDSNMAITIVAAGEASITLRTLVHPFSQELYVHTGLRVWSVPPSCFAGMDLGVP